MLQLEKALQPKSQTAKKKNKTVPGFRGKSADKEKTSGPKPRNPGRKPEF
jgi:hypothetical protein